MDAPDALDAADAAGDAGAADAADADPTVAAAATGAAAGPTPDAHPTDAPYTLRGLEAMLGLPRRAIVALVRAGFLTPARGPRNEFRFSFRDVVLLRTAHQLRSARITPRRMLRSLRRLREQLGDRPLTGVRLQAVGDEVAVHEAGGRWAAASGQRLLDFDGAPAASAAGPATVRHWPGAAIAGAAAQAGRIDAAAWFARAESLEATDPAAAEHAYREALRLAPADPDAWLNLGALLADQGRAADAVALYDAALQHRPEDPLLHFNRAIALEDAGRDADACDAYARCIRLAPEFADAHYNAARLAERLGRLQDALRHYSAYRRLT